MPPQSRGAGGRARKSRKGRGATPLESSPNATPQPAQTSQRPRLSPFRSKSFPNLHELSYLAPPASPLAGGNIIGTPQSYKFRPFPPSPFPASPLLTPSPPPSSTEKINAVPDGDNDNVEGTSESEREGEDSEDIFKRQFLSPPSSGSDEEADSEEDEDEEGEDDDEEEAVNEEHQELDLRRRASESTKPQAAQAEGQPSIPRTRSSISGSSTKQSPASRPLLSAGSRSHSFLGSSTFAPPFYNRPPTPLPPSPSLTSLLRPSLPFGNYPSRPATPESSDTEGMHNNSNAGTSINGASGAAASAVAASALTATTVPRASPKVPTYEYYGFVVYLGSSLAFIVYLLWSYLPTPILHQLGIYYYPDRWWSLAIPSWLVICICYIYVALAAWNTGTLTLGLTSLECFVDETAQVAVISAEGQIIRTGRFSSSRSSNAAAHQQREHSTPKRSKRGKHRGASKAHQAKEKQLSNAGGSAQKNSASSSSHHRNNSSNAGKMAVYGRQGIGVKRPRGQPLPELDWKTVWSYGTDGVMDVPIGGVCEILYGSSVSSSSPSSSSAPSSDAGEEEEEEEEQEAATAANEYDDEYINDHNRSNTAHIHNNTNTNNTNHVVQPGGEFDGMINDPAAWDS